MVNVNNFGDATKLANFTLENFGYIDILVNIAGGSGGIFLKTAHSIFSESSKERWEEVINLNLYGTMNCIRAVIKHMTRRNTGKIINFSIFRRESWNYRIYKNISKRSREIWC